VNPERPLGRAIQEGMTAARRKRVELETEAEPEMPRSTITPSEEG
jgi:hypothetical protein